MTSLRSRGRQRRLYPFLEKVKAADGINSRAVFLLVGAAFIVIVYLNALLATGVYRPPTIEERITEVFNGTATARNDMAARFPTATPLPTRVNPRLTPSATAFAAIYTGAADPHTPVAATATATITPSPTITQTATPTPRPTCGRVEIVELQPGQVIIVAPRVGALRLLAAPRTDGTLHDHDVRRLVWEGQRLTVTGAGVCGRWGAIETMYYPVRSDYWSSDNTGWVGTGSFSTPWVK